jgi:hypothetical protein
VVLLFAAGFIRRARNRGRAPVDDRA